MSKINFDEIYYYLKPLDKPGKTWDEVPQNKATLKKLEYRRQREALAGVKASTIREVFMGRTEEKPV
jgi:Fe-S cluster assembly protein SufB